ncbi:MAG TPA: tetratricopeptide repeat protein [Gemmatimonadaceae bacterium]|nr:tetratricopeptide repeat protein [Gemmatimonadaceae bacterium]
MFRTSLVLAAVVIAAARTNAEAQNAPAKWADTIGSEIEKANLSGDSTRMGAARALAERVAAAFPEDGLILHYEGFAIFREALLATGHGGMPTASLERAKSILEKSLKTRPLAETHVLLGSIDGQLIGADPTRAMELGMASTASTSAALRLGPNNPRVWLIRGQGAIYTPAEYGGGIKVAEDQLKHAVELFEKDAPKPGEPAWGKAEAHLWLGQVYAKQGDKAKAEAEYRTALSIAPDYSWAKGLLYGQR